MDADTEAALWPDVFQESFAREVIAMVTQAHTVAHISQVCFWVGGWLAGWEAGWVAGWVGGWAPRVSAGFFRVHCT
jgi:hypothetical protein